MYDTVRNWIVLSLKDMKNGFMMVLNRKRVKLVNKYTTTRKKPDLTSGIYLTGVKMKQFIMLAGNRGEKVGANRKQRRRQPKERFIYKASNLKIVIGASNP